MMSRGVDVTFPAPAGTQLFLAALYGSAPSGSLVEMRFRTASGMGRRFDAVERLDRVAETVLALAARTDVYVGVLPRQRRGGRRADLVEAASVVWVDCDKPSSVAALRRLRPGPGMVVASAVIRSSASGGRCALGVGRWRHVADGRIALTHASTRTTYDMYDLLAASWRAALCTDAFVRRGGGRDE